MILSQTSKIAIKAMIYLSDQSHKGRKVGIDEISEKIEASKHTVGKALQVLVRNQVLNSIKGPNGGFYLSEKQQKQPILNIVEILEGNHLFVQCGLGLSKCSEARPCPIHHEFKEVRIAIEKIFREKTIHDLRAVVSEGYAFLIG